ncbi:MAG: 3'-5' exonuclease, partial [Tissierellia bacterium]|nr:3'-5' exonuclease [Tissierellia bacterium]
NDDINLLAVMQSEIFGFNENEIAMIKLYSQKNSFYDNLISYDKEDELSNKINDFLTKIQDYNYKLQTYDVFKFAYYVFENSGYYKFLCCRDRAFERIKNVENIIGLLCEYDKKYDNGLIGFLDYVNELKVNKSDLFNSPRELSEDEDVVRIMTIHKSKGLEFPIVILADMNKQFSTQDSRENLLFDEDLGIGINLKDISTNSQFTSLRKSLIYEKLSIENKKEEMRVLYVALTRAKNNLILIGSKKRDKLLIRKSYLEINNTLDWVLKALNTDKIMSEYTDSDYNTDIFDDTKLKINIIESENLKQNHDFEEVKFIEDEYQDKRLVDFMDKTFNFIYPFEEETNKAFKFSVTEISKSFDQSDSGYVNDMNTYELDFTKPDFMVDQTRISPQQRGTIIHTIFQNLSLKKHSRNSLIEEINEMVKDDKLLLEEIKLVDYDKILKFFDHKITKSLINKSDKIVREESFLMKLEDNYINGQIDFYAIIENTIIIVDIKTDFQMRSSIYKKQLEYYQMAVEKALGMKVIKKYLYWYNYNKYEEV